MVADCLESEGTARELGQEMRLKKYELIEGPHMGKTTSLHISLHHYPSPAVQAVRIFPQTKTKENKNC